MVRVMFTSSQFRIVSYLRRGRGKATALVCLFMLFGGFTWFERDEPMVRWAEPDNDSLDVKFSPDGRAMLRFFEEIATLRDLETGEIVPINVEQGLHGKIDHAQLVEVAWMGQGRLLVGVIRGVSATPDGAVLPHKSLHVWNVPSGRERMAVAKVGHSGGFLPTYTISDDGSTIAYLMNDPDKSTVGVWRTDGDKPPASFAGLGPIALSSDGRFLVLYETSFPTVKLIVWDVRSSKLVATIHRAWQEWPQRVAVSRNGNWVAESQGAKLVLHRVSTSSRTVLDCADRKTIQPWFSPDGFLFSSRPVDDRTGVVEVWNLNADRPENLYRGKIGSISRDGREMIQEEDNSEICTVIKISSELDSNGKSITSSIVEGARVHKERNTACQSIDGASLAYLDDQMEVSILGRVLSWMPAGVSFARPKWKRVLRVVATDTDTGRVLKSILLPELCSQLDLKVVANGQKLVVRSSGGSINSGTGEPNKIRSRVEVWDLSGSPSMIARIVGMSLLTFVALGLGEWYDRKAMRRMPSSPANSLA